MGEHSRTYAVIGTGAVGGFYGARLVEAGCPVHFLLHSDFDHVVANGLVVESPLGDATLVNGKFPGGFHQSVSNLPECDFVLVALKTTQNHLLEDLLPPLVTDSTTVVMLQNGLGVEAEAAAIVGGDKVVGGMCFLCSNKVGPGHIRHLDYGLITLADYGRNGAGRGITEPMRLLAEDFGRAGIPISLEEDLLSARWKKLVWNIPFNGLSVVLDATTEELMAREETRGLATALIEEVVTGATACGATIPSGYASQMVQSTGAMKPYLTSMKLDADAGRPLEIDAMYARPLRAAATAGVRLPLIEMLYGQLAFIDARSSSASSEPGTRQQEET